MLSVGIVRVALLSAAVTCAVLMADYLALGSPYWAGITVIVYAVPERKAFWWKVIYRLLGSYIGALAGLLLASATASSALLFILTLFAVVFFSMYRAQIAKASYAWFIGSLTCAMVMVSIVDGGHQSVTIAFWRASEVTVGSFCALLLHVYPRFFSPPAKIEVLVVSSVELRTKNALTPAITVCLALWIWIALNYPGGNQGIISACALALTGSFSAVWRKAFQRFAGCLLGAAVGLIAVMSAIQSTIVFIAVVYGVIFAFMWIRCYAALHSYLGMQAAVAFLVAFAGGVGPPTSMEAVILRLTGIGIGAFTFIVVEAGLTRIFKRN